MSAEEIETILLKLIDEANEIKEILDRIIENSIYKYKARKSKSPLLADSEL